jgi:hypothetical protein
MYQDDASIADEDRLFRRIHLTQIVKDDDTGLARISSGAFRDKELSVNIESVLLNDGKEPRHCLRSYLIHKLASITAGGARQYQQVVCRDPLPDDPSHGLVWGSKNSRRVHVGLTDAATWVIPDQAPLYSDILREKRAHGVPE